MRSTVLAAYGFDKEETQVQPYGSGLINRTWKVVNRGRAYILQRINHVVFSEPRHIAGNIRLISDYLQAHHPQYLFAAPLLSAQGNDMVHSEGEGFFRLFPFVEGSHVIDVAARPEQAHEAAVQFGRFTRLLGGINMERFRAPIPFFHDLTFRFRKFNDALQKSEIERKEQARPLAKIIIGHEDIVKEYGKIVKDPQFRLRITHHDTKISNVLFDEKGKGLCVIDLDTVFPGYFISDVGDMMRTYLSPVSEEETDFGKIAIRDEFYHAIVKGYHDEMKDELTVREKKYFFYAGKFMIYMQALRFLTDYLENDSYYGSQYPGHNLVRAGNQLNLLSRLLEKEKLLNKGSVLDGAG